MTTATAITKRSPIQRIEGAEVTTQIVFGRGEDGEQIGMLVKSDRRGKARIAIRNVRLTFGRKELYSFKRDANDESDPGYADPNVSAVGYDRLNEFAGILMDTPETQLDDNNRVIANPQMIREPGTGNLQAVRVMMRGIGVSQSGNVVTHRCSKYFSLTSYLGELLLAKWKGYKDGDQPKGWGTLRVRDKIDPKEMADGTKCAIAIPPNLALIVDLTHTAVHRILGEFVTLEKFALDRAQTMCRRNLLKRFFGVTKPRISRGADGLHFYFVPVTCLIRHNEDYADMAAAIQQVQDGVVFTEEGPQEVEETPIQYDNRTSAEDAHDELDGDDEFSPQEDPEPDDGGTGPSPAEESREDTAARAANLRGTVKMIAEQLAASGAEHVKTIQKIYADHKMRSYVDVDQCGDLAKLTSLVDAFTAARRAANRKDKGGQGSLLS